MSIEKGQEEYIQSKSGYSPEGEMQPQQQQALPPGFIIYQPKPSPRGTPRRGFFITGGIGMLIVAAMAIAIGTFALLGFPYSFYFGYGYYYGTSGLEFVSVILNAIFYSGLLISLFGFYGFYKNYGSILGLGTFIFGLIASTFFMISSILPLLFTRSYYYSGSYPEPWALVLAMVGLILVGVLFILEGSSFMSQRHFTGIGEAHIPVGVILMIAGSFICTLYLVSVSGYFLLAGASIIGGLIFLKARIPFVQHKQAEHQDRQSTIPE